MGDIPAADSNLLWLRSRGACAKPDCENLLMERDGDRWVTQGERAHIRSERPDGPRYDAGYPNPNSYENLLLLCQADHTLIDAQPELYPVDMLEAWKKQHESPFPASQGLVVSPPPLGSRYRRRAAAFDLLATALQVSRVVVLTGISGIGKTQLAGDYFRSSTDAYSIRVWIRATDSAVAMEDFARLGSFLGLSLRADEPISDFCARVREALVASPGWLIVFDGAPDEAAIAHLVPHDSGHVVVTSQSQAWAPTRCQLGDLDPGEARAILDEDHGFRSLSNEDKDRAVQAAGALPLTLVQLMGYRAATGVAAEVAVELFAGRRAELLARGAPPDHPSAQAALVEALTALPPVANELLAALAFLAADPLPVPSQVLVGVDETGTAPIFADRLDVEDAVASLRSFSLVEREGDKLAVHSLVQEIVRGAASEAEAAKAKLQAIYLLMMALPDRSDRVDLVPAAVVLLPHVRALVEHAGDLQGAGASLASILNRLAPVHGLVGDRPSERRDLEMARKLLASDPAHADPVMEASILNNLANCFAGEGDIGTAIEMTAEALTLKRRHGAEPDLLAITLGSYGQHLEKVGRLEEALDAHVEAAELLVDDEGQRLADALVDQARVLAFLDRNDESLATADRAIDAARRDANAWTELSGAYLAKANVYERTGDPQRALTNAELAVDAAEIFRGPSRALAQALDTRGRCRQQNGLTPEGVADLRRAVEMFATLDMPSMDHAAARGNLGVALLHFADDTGHLPSAGEGLGLLRDSAAEMSGLVAADHPTRLRAEEMLRRARQSVLGVDPPV